MSTCAKCHGTKRIPLGIVAGVARCDRCDGSGEEPMAACPDPDLTPVDVPDARRRRSSTSLRAPVPCPKCHKGSIDARVDCDLCFNSTVGGCTRYVDPEKAKAWTEAQPK